MNALKKFDDTKLVGLKKKKRWRSGTVALREIKKLQKTVHHLIPKRSFYRVVKEIAQTMNVDSMMTVSAVDALQEAAEAYMIDYFRIANDFCIHGERKTINKRDLDIAKVFIKDEKGRSTSSS